ncbi:TetR family transcriptional regulator [Gordonia sp. LSe1-13]|uniref:TetR family transcriptional regulator n=1 Tax=Gordonia sesuvii TaxID=3116777 RepID=A0ABU7MAS7_9ACTN|nr:TetR family transcriptional regulator [Gordonia sp. LSe1-13]
MAWDTERTRRKILDAATDQFVAHGPHGTTIEKIARAAGVNKERIYNYFGGKDALFERVLREHVASASTSVPVPSNSAREVGAYAGDLFDYLIEHPQLMRLLQWEALTIDGDAPDEAERTSMYANRTRELGAGQKAGALADDFEPDVLNVLILGIVGYWMLLPQVTRMITGTGTPGAGELARRRNAVIEAATRLATPIRQ